MDKSKVAKSEILILKLMCLMLPYVLAAASRHQMIDVMKDKKP